MKLIESIHHGDYRNTRTGDVSSYDDFSAWIDDSPYNQTMSTDYRAKLWKSLNDTHSGFHGWANYRTES